jgi:hypothetical protein
MMAGGSLICMDIPREGVIFIVINRI